MQNRHPADRLADVRFEIKRLEGEEAKLRAYLLEHPHDRVGEEHIAVIGSQSRKRVNLKGGRGWCFPVATFSPPSGQPWLCGCNSGRRPRAD